MERSAANSSHNDVECRAAHQPRAGVPTGGRHREDHRSASVFGRPLDVGGLKMAHWLEGAGVVTVGLANHGVGNLDFALSITELPV